MQVRRAEWASLCGVYNGWAVGAVAGEASLRVTFRFPLLAHNTFCSDQLNPCPGFPPAPPRTSTNNFFSTFLSFIPNAVFIFPLYLLANKQAGSYISSSPPPVIHCFSPFPQTPLLFFFIPSPVPKKFFTMMLNSPNPNIWTKILGKFVTRLKIFHDSFFAGHYRQIGSLMIINPDVSWTFSS